MIVIILSTLILIYFFSIPAVRPVKFGRPVGLTCRIILLVAVPLLMALLVAESYNIYPGQYWVTKLIFWLVVFSCMIAYGLCDRSYFASFERMVYKIIFFLPLAFLLFLFIPFLGIGYGLRFYVSFIGDSKFILYNDNEIRIEQPYIRFLGPDPQPVLYVKKNLMSFQDTTLPFNYNDEKDKIVVTRRGDSSYTIILKSPDNRQVPAGTDTFYYDLGNHHR